MNLAQNRRGHRHGFNPLPVLLAAGLVVSLTGATCPGSETEVVLKGVSRGLHYYVDTHPRPGPLTDLAGVMASSIDQGTSIEKTIDRIAVSEDPYGEALATALCQGLESYANQVDVDGDDVIVPSAGDWASYLEDAVQTLLPQVPSFSVATRVNQFNNAANLASINPRLAVTYAQECVLR